MKITRIKLIAYLGIGALLASMIVGLLGYSTSAQDINRVKDQLLTMHVRYNIELSLKYVLNSYGALRAGNGTLLDQNGATIEGRFGAVDEVLSDLGDRSTIFVKVNDDFKRISTNVMNPDNERAIGTFLGKEHVAYGTVMRGDIYIGEADILGVNYYTAYDPIKDANNNVIGLLFVGTPTQTLDQMIDLHETKMSGINLSIIILRTVSLGSLIALVAAAAVRGKRQTDPSQA